MPKVLAAFLGYAFYFWANEKLEPIHIHVSKGVPTANSTKFWITSATVELANNNSRIGEKDLKEIRKYLMLNRERIISQWIGCFGYGEVKK